jgi:hypothetical protein
MNVLSASARRPIDHVGTRYHLAMMRPIAAAIAMMLVGTTMAAHHSIAGVYDSSRKITIEGVVAQFQFINPHPVLLVDVVNRDGAAERWRLELDNRHELSDIGVTSRTLAPGDRVVATGSPARTQSRGLYLLRLDRPADGFWYEQVGQSPRIRGLSR